MSPSSKSKHALHKHANSRAAVQVEGFSCGTYSQFMSHMTCISKNEKSIQISLCEWNVEHFSENLSEKDVLTEKKRFKILGKQLLFLILNAVM